MPSTSALSVVERRGTRGHVGWLVLAGYARTTRPRSDVEAQFPLHGCTLVTAGRGRYRDARHDVALGPGSLVLVAPGHRHNYGAGPDGWEERFLAFDGPMFRLAAENGLLDIERPVRKLGDVERWSARFDHFRLRPPPTTPAERDAEAALVLALLADMVAAAESTDLASSADWAERSRVLLGANLAVRIDLATVAAAVGLSYESWRRMFKSTVGVSPARYRLDLRLSTAADRMLTTSSNAREIAADLGFVDERHLTIRFKETYGCTPAAYRRQRTTTS